MPSYPANRIAPASNYLLGSFLCYIMNGLHGPIFPHWYIVVQDMKVLTLFRMTALQIGHNVRLRAHSLHATRWPQGTNTTETSLSRHTLHILSSCRRRSCSSVLSRDSSFPPKRKKSPSFSILTAPKELFCHLKAVTLQVAQHFIQRLT